MKKKSILLGALLSLTLLATGCAKSSDSAAPPATANGPSGEPDSPISDYNQQDPSNPQYPANPADQSTVVSTAQILLFNGIGISATDWKSLEQIIQSMGLSYRLVNTSALTNMTLTDMEKFKLIIIPGGNSNTINSSLSKTTKIKVRKAVRDGGVSFLGICAGAFAGVGTDAKSNITAYYGFSVALGDWLKHWYPNGDSSIPYAIPRISFADGTSRNITWWDGPATTEWAHGVVARYPDGIPAISQTWNGNGFIIMSGVHPEAPSSWQYDTGPDPDGLDHDIAIKLIGAAMNRQPLPVY